jgi:hypothetical protein
MTRPQNNEIRPVLRKQLSLVIDGYAYPASDGQAA